MFIFLIIDILIISVPKIENILLDLTRSKY